MFTGTGERSSGEAMIKVNRPSCKVLSRQIHHATRSKRHAWSVSACVRARSIFPRCYPESVASRRAQSKDDNVSRVFEIRSPWVLDVAGAAAWCNLACRTAGFPCLFRLGLSSNRP